MNSILYFTLNGESCTPLTEALKSSRISINLAHSLHHAQEELLTRRYQAAICRCDTICNTIFELNDFIKRHGIPTKMLVSAKVGGVEEAVRLLRTGIVDFLVSPAPDQRIAHSINKVLSSMKEAEPSSETAEPITAIPDNEDVLIGPSPAIAELRSAISLVSKSQTSVLITGESGTGKEIVARHIHRDSYRAGKPFIAMNCAALPKDVLENELFGHEKGAFTGALVKKTGCFEMAHNGTLFFDEIAEMAPDVQPKLLRAIELKTFRRLGGKDEVSVDVRLIAATNKNISKALKSGEFREDLYYRLSTIEIIIPPLREHKEDIVPLCQHFLGLFSEKYGKEIQQFSDESTEMLIAYDWPGNVRELRNVVERSVVICRDSVIGPQHLPQRITRAKAPDVRVSIPIGSSMEEAERMFILQTLASVQNNKSKAARILGVSRKTLHNKLDLFTQRGISPDGSFGEQAFM